MPGVLESEGPCSAVFECGSCAFLPSTHNQEDGLDTSGTHESSDDGGLRRGIDKKELPAMEPGAMCYMLSKQGYLTDRDGHWYPHLMFFVSQTDPAAWGADVPGSPVLASNDT